MLEELAAWYRDLVAVAVGAGEVLIHADRAAELSADGTRERLAAAEDAVETVRAAFRCLQELNLARRLRWRLCSFACMRFSPASRRSSR